jgi:hypothetical protein
MECEVCKEITNDTYTLNNKRVCEECCIDFTFNVKNVSFLFREPPTYVCGICEKVIGHPEFVVRCNGEKCKYGIRFMCNTHAKWGIQDNTWLCPKCAKYTETIE